MLVGSPPGSSPKNRLFNGSRRRPAFVRSPVNKATTIIDMAVAGWFR
jgi:hypothetical protein